MRYLGRSIWNDAFPVIVFSMIAVTVSSEADAEVYAIPKGFGWRASVPLQLIEDDAVVADLGLDPMVGQKLRNLHRKIQAEVETKALASIGPYDTPAELPAREKLEWETWTVPNLRVWNAEICHTVRNGHAAEINQLLTPEQQSRLHQIHLQIRVRQLPRPTDALSDPGIARELGLTQEQRTRIQAVHSAIQTAELHRRSPRYTGKNWSQLLAESPDEIMKILSVGQRAAFVQLKGTPLNSVSNKAGR